MGNQILSRVSDAWAALCGRPRVVTETVYVPGPASIVEVFVGDVWPDYDRPMSYGKVPRYYATCAQAHAECHGEIVKRQVIKFADGELYKMPDGGYLSRIQLQPKPKRAKGAK